MLQYARSIAADDAAGRQVLQLLLQACAKANLLEACKVLIEECNANADKCSKYDDRTPRSIGVGSTNPDVRRFFKRLGAFLERYQALPPMPPAALLRGPASAGVRQGRLGVGGAHVAGFATRHLGAIR